MYFLYEPLIFAKQFFLPFQLSWMDLLFYTFHVIDQNVIFYLAAIKVNIFKCCSATTCTL